MAAACVQFVVEFNDISVQLGRNSCGKRESAKIEPITATRVCVWLRILLENREHIWIGSAAPRACPRTHAVLVCRLQSWNGYTRQKLLTGIKLRALCHAEVAV